MTMGDKDSRAIGKYGEKERRRDRIPVSVQLFFVKLFWRDESNAHLLESGRVFLRRWSFSRAALSPSRTRSLARANSVQ